MNAAATAKCQDGARPITRSKKKSGEVLDLFAPALPTPEPVPTPPAWAIEAATAPASPAPELPTRVRARDFATATERVWDGADCFVLRTRVYSGHEYRAYERSHTHGFAVVYDPDPVFGRIDTRCPSIAATDPHAAIEGQLAREAEARALIHRLCPETVLREGERAVGNGVYDGPGYVLVTVDPEVRYQAATGGSA
ncbi:MAG: hypothetical protein JNL82_14360 [Myxococcales bacterium]|nr:hypothetical protein [Myxococcales bacterium]